MNTPIKLQPPNDGAVADYIANRLSESEAVAFEEYCLRDREFALQVEHEIALKSGICKALQAMQPKRRSERLSYALAAGILLIVTGIVAIHPWDWRKPTFAFSALADMPENVRHAPRVKARILTLRGENTMTTVRGSINDVFDLQFLPEVSGPIGEYQVEAKMNDVKDSGFERVILKAASDGYLHLYFVANHMIGHVATITLTTIPNPSGKSWQYQVEFANSGVGR
jgi:hypothetical protein